MDRARQKRLIIGIALSCCLLALSLSLSACGTKQNGSKAPVVQMGGKGSSAGIATVQQDDSLWLISRRYNLPLRDIIYLNNLHSPFVIHEGQRLQLPPPREYVVKQGDTLYEISRMFQTDMRSVARLNNMRKPYRIYPKQTLRMPSPSLGDAQYAAVIQPDEKPFRNSDGRMKPPSKPASYTKSIKVPKRTKGGKFALPVQGRVLSTYGPKKGGFHNDGINLAAPKGTPVRAAENGVVAYTGDNIEGFGQLVLIRHADRYMTAYGHLGKTLVKRGQKIGRGEVIGKVGSTGNVDRPQLHFEIRRGTKALNPQKYM